MKKITFSLILLAGVLALSSCVKKITGCTDSSATNYNADANEDDGNCTYHTIGESYGGGIIFYLDNTNKHGLIAAPSDQGTGITWDNGQSITTYATGTVIGTGQTNTTAIVSAQGAGNYAAKLCDDLVLSTYTDWFLPSEDELKELRIQKLAGKVNGFANEYYWSSSEYNNKDAYYVHMGSNPLYGHEDIEDNVYYPQNPSKSMMELKVRAIRAF